MWWELVNSVEETESAPVKIEDQSQSTGESRNNSTSEHTDFQFKKSVNNREKRSS